jgi:hypothetical protein
MANTDWEKNELTKDLIKLSKNLTIDDWRIIRKNNYYKIRDNLQGNQQMNFIKARITTYLSQK